MADLNPQHMIEEIQDNIKTGDAMKTQLVLSHLGDVDKKTQNRLIYELTRGEVSSVFLSCCICSPIMPRWPLNCQLSRKH